MGEPHRPPPARLVVGMLSADEALMGTVAKELAELFGPIDYRSPLIPFTQTTYYDHELGTPIFRRFLSFSDPFPPDGLATAKLLTNSVEQRYRLRGNRRVNLDPSYLTLAKLVLATTKDHAHRIYLGQGIYAEVTLHYRGGTFEPWPWTYPDYRTPEYLAVFHELRARLASSSRSPDLTEGRTP
ncbi:MAG: DUF4416 family protein [Anaerolineae bacterium]|nr:DUF4416 family protein [Anaerolineae bacterium]